MEQPEIYVKNMVCNRCIMVVDSILRNLGIIPISVGLGIVVLEKKLCSSQLPELKYALEAVGFELIIDNRKERLAEQVKNTVIELIHRDNGSLKTNLSDFIAEKLFHDYTYISNLFSEITGITIEKYYIAQKIERVKELLIYGDLTLNEIADLLNYSSTAYLSTQFKKITGMTPGQFKRQGIDKRNPLDKV